MAVEADAARRLKDLQIEIVDGEEALAVAGRVTFGAKGIEAVGLEEAVELVAAA